MPTKAGKPSWVVRLIISVAILFHLAAVIAPPLSFSMPAPREAGLLPQRLFFALRPYIDALHLNHGYAFFAPDPPDDTFLLRYRVTFDDGREPIEGKLPDLDKHWPRLLYHRHFMLADQLNSQFVPLDVVREMTSEEARQMVTAEEIAGVQTARARYLTKWNSFKNHLLKVHNADHVELFRVRHAIPDLLEFRENPRPFTDEATYFDQSEEFGGDASLRQQPALIPPANGTDNQQPPAEEITLPTGAGS